MFVLIVIDRGVNGSVRTGTEAEMKALFPSVTTWQNFGYKQGAHLTEYTSLELFEVSGNTEPEYALQTDLDDLRSETQSTIDDLREELDLLRTHVGEQVDLLRQEIDEIDEVE